MRRADYIFNFERHTAITQKILKYVFNKIFSVGSVALSLGGIQKKPLRHGGAERTE